ncbi:MAG TPA: S-methyl-5-thioribose-1-phosphate isomerase [Burkholderiales bacterium]|nr:S-methyl-5-thioribose-1-phosphate isomerase [Burkholderiales bacterium]
MKVEGVDYRSVWRDGNRVAIIDQTRLPYEFNTLRLSTAAEAAHAISTMQVRGAPLIGATAAYGVALAMREDASDVALERAVAMLAGTRPTAVNLRWALDRMVQRLQPVSVSARESAAWAEAESIAEEDVAINRAIGKHGLPLLREIARRKGGAVNVLTHCNAGWIATVDVGTALAPIYLAHDEGIDVHVWVDETRPRSQGLLTAWELGAHGVAHTLIADNAGGHLMQRDQVDLVIVGVDRVTAEGDVCNKIGTYLKALAAYDNGVPFYAAAPTPSIDLSIEDAFTEIPIEERGADELLFVRGTNSREQVERVRIGAEDTQVANPAFDVTPARLVTAFITERGVVPASREGLAAISGEKTR